METPKTEQPRKCHGRLTGEPRLFVYTTFPLPPSLLTPACATPIDRRCSSRIAHGVLAAPASDQLPRAVPLERNEAVAFDPGMHGRQALLERESLFMHVRLVRGTARQRRDGHEDALLVAWRAGCDGDGAVAEDHVARFQARDGDASAGKVREGGRAGGDV